MEIFEILQGLILSASIFSKMGTGSQSGKLFFKRLYSGDNIVIQDGPTIMTVSNTFNQCPVILDRVVMGTGDNITNSCSGLANLNFYNDGGYKAFAWGKYFNNIQNYDTKTTPIFVDTYTGVTMSGFANSIGYAAPGNMIISGANNYLNSDGSYAVNDIIIGGRNNYLGDGVVSSIIGGRGNKLINPKTSENSKFSQCAITLVGGFKNCSKCSYRSVILGGRCNSLIESNINLIISGECNSFTGASTSKSCQNAIISSKTSSISYKVYNTSIFSSYKVKVNNFGPTIDYGICNNILISSQYSQILGSGSVKYNSYNSLISSVGNKIHHASYGDIIGGCKNCIYMNWEQDTNFISLKYNSIITSMNSCIQRDSQESSNFVSLGYSSIISSYISRIRSSSKNDEFKFISIIGGYCNSNNVGSSGQSLILSSMISGRKNFIQSREDEGFSSLKSSCATIIGGSFLTASGGVLIGGQKNRTRTINATIIGGYCNRSYSKILGGYCNQGLTPSIIVGSYKVQTLAGPDDTAHISGSLNCSALNRYGSIVGGINNLMIGTCDSIMLVGCCNCIDAATLSNNVKSNFIIGGNCNKFFSNSGSKCACETYRSGILGGCKNFLYKRTNTISNTVILGGSGLSSSESNSMVVPNLWVTGTMSTGSPGHFTQSFTYSHDGLTGNFSNVNDIIFVNGLVVGVTTAPIVYNDGLVFKINASSTSFDLSGVSSSVVLVNWGDLSSTTYSRSPSNTINASHTYGSIGDYIIKVHGTFSGFTASGNQVSELTEFSQLTRIKVNSSQLNTVDNTEFTSQTAWTSVDFNDSSLNLASVNNILIALDAQATVPTYVGLSQSPARIPTGGGSVSRANLIADGAVVITNWF